MISGLSDLEQQSDVDDLLGQYERTISAKTARYIKFCDVKAYNFWKRNAYEDAIEWATKGFDLKRTSQVDTEHDCAEILALSRRDGGEPEAALEFYLKDQQLEKMIDPADSSVDEATLLGNVGRCLQMMGQTDDALVCFRKSAKILESDGSARRLSNQAFARQWIGEVFETKGDKAKALLFYSDAEELLRKAFPGRARVLQASIEKLFDGNPIPSRAQADVRRRVDRWIHGDAP